LNSLTILKSLGESPGLVYMYASHHNTFTNSEVMTIDSVKQEVSQSSPPMIFFWPQSIS